MVSLQGFKFHLNNVSYRGLYCNIYYIYHRAIYINFLTAEEATGQSYFLGINIIVGETR